jgi:hypothetical protein
MTTPVKLLALEGRIRDEVAAARTALKVALQHAANAGSAYTAVRDVLTQSQVQAWLASTTCVLIAIRSWQCDGSPCATCMHGLERYPI